MGSKILAFLQRIGRSLMMPIAVLPAAALLLRFGAPDMLNIPVLAKAGGAIFDNLPLLFAVGVGLGFAKDAGAAALSAAVGFLVTIAAGQQTYIWLLGPGVDPASVGKFDLGVLPGILIGIIAGLLYQRYHKIKLPRFLGFFGGKRFVPIITSLVAVVLGVALGLVYQPVSNGLTAAGNWILGSGAVGAFCYGVVNRLLIPFGFHHIINTMVWFQFGTFMTPDGPVHGEITRFLAGDPSAGGILAGFYPIMMFGLPAAALAMLHEAKGTQAKLAGGILISAALTSLVTGITEPIEFSFMFLAPVLYLVHSLLTGASLALCYVLGCRDAFGFSAGLIDYLLNFTLAAKPLLLLAVGVGTGALYYVLFRWSIRFFDLKTPGREDEPEVENPE